MINLKTLALLENEMRDRRNQILDFRDSLKSSRHMLQEPENELEEMAGKEMMLDDVARLDSRVVDELRKIEAALARMKSGSYGRCENCGRPIASKRLQAIPWTMVCKRCAQHSEDRPMTDAEEDELPEAELTDEQIVLAIWDELDLREDLDPGNLEIVCNDGTIYLGGNVPGEKEHQQIVEIVEEDLGYEDVIDHIDNDASAEDEGYEEENASLDEDAEEDPYAAMMDNRSGMPVDVMVSDVPR